MNKKNLFGVVYGVLIGSNIPYDVNEVMFWVISIPLIIGGILLYGSLKD